MDRKEGNGMNEQALKRIVALLFALAAVADCASGRSRLFRRLMLWLLRPAEAAAWAFVIGALRDAPPPYGPTPALLDDTPTGLMRLATSLRMLAAILDGLPAEAFAHWLEDYPQIALDIQSLLAHLGELVSSPPAVQIPARRAYHDTS